MQGNKANQYSIGVPILFTLLFLSSVVGIIGAAFSLDAAVQGSGGYDVTSNHPLLIVRIIVASILSLLFLLLTIFGLVEVGEPYPYKARFLTDKFELKLRQIANNLESWELLLILSNYVTLPVGLTLGIIDNSSSFLIISFVSITVVTISYNYRMGTRDAIKRVLPRYHEISLDSLSQAVSRDQNRVKRSLMYLISYENFPATYDFGSNMIIYNSTERIENPLEHDAVIAEAAPNTTQRATKKSNKVKLKPCPFCDTMPIDARARFCHDCGASILPAK